MPAIQETSKRSISEPLGDRSSLDTAQAIGADRKLPYAPHQRAEFLNIQAETEALLQQLYIETHRRQLSAQP
jgi:hypothetical protein